LLKLSDDDAAWLSGGADPGTVAKGWLDAGVDAVVLTRGASGLAVHTGSGETSVPSAPARLVDTIGAGDTVQGALLAWLHRHDVRTVTQLCEADWRAALDFAAKAAAITVSRSGAEPPEAEEIV
jgi:fructokinase